MNNQYLKHRIASISDTAKITKAMQMIAASKMNKAQQKCEESFQYLSAYDRALSMIDVAALMAYLPPPKTDKEALFVVAGEKGLCGDYNHKILSFAKRYIEENNIKIIFVIGYEAMRFFEREGIFVVADYVHLQEPHGFDAILLAQDLLDMYEEGVFGSVSIAYTRTPSVTKQEPFVKKIWPIQAEKKEGATLPVEPLSHEAARNFCHQYLVADIYSALADCNIAIQFKRMTAMQESTDNGLEIIEELTRLYNHSRQESITNELMTACASGMRGKV